MIGSEKVKLLPKTHLPTTITSGSSQENLSYESMLDKEICQAIDTIHLLTSITYTIVCIVFFPSLLHYSITHIEKKTNLPFDFSEDVISYLK